MIFTIINKESIIQLKRGRTAEINNLSQLLDLVVFEGPFIISKKTGHAPVLTKIPK